MYRPRRLHRAILAAGLFLCLLTRIAAAEQFNTPDGSNYGSTDSAFKLYWDSTTDTLKLYAAPSGNAGNPITWVEGLTMDTGGASLFQVGNDAGACTASKLGRIRYNGTSTWEYCNGTAWNGLATSTAGGWTDGGTDVYLTTLTDKVGIGTASPSSLLHTVQTDTDNTAGYKWGNYFQYTVSPSVNHPAGFPWTTGRETAGVYINSYIPGANTRSIGYVDGI